MRSVSDSPSRLDGPAATCRTSQSTEFQGTEPEQQVGERESAWEQRPSKCRRQTKGAIHRGPARQGSSQERCPEDAPCPGRRKQSPLPVPPPPWPALSAGKMPEHLSHSTCPAKHSSVMMCSAFWHRLLTPSSLRKLILA